MKKLAMLLGMIFLLSILTACNLDDLLKEAEPQSSDSESSEFNTIDESVNEAEENSDSSTFEHSQEARDDELKREVEGLEKGLKLYLDHLQDKNMPLGLAYIYPDSEDKLKSIYQEIWAERIALKDSGEAAEKDSFFLLGGEYLESVNEGSLCLDQREMIFSRGDFTVGNYHGENLIYIELIDSGEPVDGGGILISASSELGQKLNSILDFFISSIFIDPESDYMGVEQDEAFFEALKRTEEKVELEESYNLAEDPDFSIEIEPIAGSEVIFTIKNKTAWTANLNGDFKLQLLEAGTWVDQKLDFKEDLWLEIRPIYEARFSLKQPAGGLPSGEYQVPFEIIMEGRKFTLEANFTIE
ncbi:MAG: hypothetical protein Q4P08_04440 [Eubacteriales bacterium]|nr:hypothetical protein [Eubacteriales bacterium]